MDDFPETKKELSDLITTLKNNEEMRIDLGKFGIEYIKQQYCIKKGTKKLSQLYEQTPKVFFLKNHSHL